MAKKKKIGSAGRFGARYGLRQRKRILAVEKFQKQKHKCHFCKKNSVKRLAMGIWHCTACDKKFAGKAYEPGLSKKEK